MATSKSSKGVGDKIEGGAAAPSQAQLATGEPAGEQPTPEETIEAANADSVGAADEIQFFASTVVKLDADGNEVMSDHLAPGETLRRSTDAEVRYMHSDRHTDRAAALREEAANTDEKRADRTDAE